MTIFLIIVGFIVTVPALIALSAILNGWVLSILWKWFMVPTLGLPDISLASAIGIALVISYLTYQPVDCEPKERETGEKVVYLGMLVLRPFFVLFFGWIVHLFM